MGSVWSIFLARSSRGGFIDVETGSFGAVEALWALLAVRHHFVWLVVAICAHSLRLNVLLTVVSRVALVRGQGVGTVVAGVAADDVTSLSSESAGIALLATRANVAAQSIAGNRLELLVRALVGVVGEKRARCLNGGTSWAVMASRANVAALDCSGWVGLDAASCAHVALLADLGGVVGNLIQLVTVEARFARDPHWCTCGAVVADSAVLTRPRRGTLRDYIRAVIPLLAVGDLKLANCTFGSAIGGGCAAAVDSGWADDALRLEEGCSFSSVVSVGACSPIVQALCAVVVSATDDLRFGGCAQVVVGGVGAVYTVIDCVRALVACRAGRAAIHANLILELACIAFRLKTVGAVVSHWAVLSYRP